MKVLILDRSPSNKRLEVAEFISTLKNRGVNYEIHEVDSKEGTSLASLYDLLSYPAVAIVRDDGQLVMRWQNTLPLISDTFKYYMV